MQDTDETSLGPVRVLVQTTGFGNENAESRLSNEKQCLCTAGAPVPLSPKPNGTVSPGCRRSQAGDARRPQGQDAEGQANETSNGRNHGTISVGAQAKKKYSNRLHRAWKPWSTKARTNRMYTPGCLRACTGHGRPSQAFRRLVWRSNSMRQGPEIRAPQVERMSAWRVQNVGPWTAGPLVMQA